MPNMKEEEKLSAKFESQQDLSSLGLKLIFQKTGSSASGQLNSVTVLEALLQNFRGPKVIFCQNNKSIFTKMFFLHSAPLHPLYPPHLAHSPSFLAPYSHVIFPKKILWPSPPSRWRGTYPNTPIMLHL